MKDGDFSNLADNYHKSRCNYPDNVIKYISSSFSTVKFPLTLDLGCGTGKSTRQIASKEMLTVGCDPDKGMITKAIEFPSVNTSYCVGKSNQLPFSDNTFDFITTFGAFHWIIWKNKDKSLSEIQRVLKRNSIFQIINKSKQTPLTGSAKDIITKYASEKLPEPHRNYYPEKVLEEYQFKEIEKKVFTVHEEYTIPEAVLHMQTMSSWNFVEESKKEKAIDEFERKLAIQYSDRTLQFESQVIVVSGKNNK